MSFIATNILKNDVEYSSTFRIDRNITIKHIRAHLEKHGTANSGDITISIKQSSTILKEAIVTVDKINEEILADYAHGFFRFDFDGLVLHHNYENEFTEYEIVTKITNHINDDDNFISLVADLNAPIANIYDTISSVIYGYQFYIY